MSRLASDNLSKDEPVVAIENFEGICRIPQNRDRARSRAQFAEWIADTMDVKYNRLSSAFDTVIHNSLATKASEVYKKDGHYTPLLPPPQLLTLSSSSAPSDVYERPRAKSV